MCPGPQFPTLGDGDGPNSSCQWEGPVPRAEPRPLRDFVLRHKEPSLGAGGLCGPCRLAAPPPTLSAEEAAASAGGASLGRRRRHVLDTGLSGLEPPHKSLGRRRNKGLFHTAAEKPQISSLVLHRRGGAGSRPCKTPPHQHQSAHFPSSPASSPGRRREPHNAGADPLSAAQMPPGPPVHFTRLNSAPWGPGAYLCPLPVLTVLHHLLFPE